MLTPRGWWFLVVVLILLAGMVLTGISTLIFLFLTLFLWFAAQWLLFAVRVKVVVRGLRVRREVHDERGPVANLWAGRSFEVRAVLTLDGSAGLPYVWVRDRVPFAVTYTTGETECQGPITAAEPLEVRYTVRCPAPGRARFEGIGIRMADLQGFFYHAAFVTGVAEYPVLPPLASAEGRTPTVKRHNILPAPGLHRHPRPGSGSELLDLRDYMAGDPPKTIAWKVSARRDRLITKVFESEVPVRCTLIVDTSHSVRVRPPGKNALTRLVEIAAAVAQAGVGARDLVGLGLFDEHGVATYLRPARGPRHLVKVLNVLADAAGLAPATGEAEVSSLLPLAHAFAEEVYPHLVRPDLNRVPAWLPWVWPKPASTVRRPNLADRLFGWLPWLLLAGGLVIGGLLAGLVFLLDQVIDADGQVPWMAPALGGVAALFVLGLTQRLLFYRRRWQLRRRKRVAALLAVRYGLAPGGLGLLLEDDAYCSVYLQRFLNEHHVPYALPFYDARGRYLFASPGKVEVLAGALLRAVGKGHDNELYVLLADLLELTDDLAPLLRAVKVTLARHHQVLVLCPWPPGVPPPDDRRQSTPVEPAALPGLLGDVREADAVRFRRAFQRLRRTFARFGVPVLCAQSGDPVRLVLERLNRLRVLGRRKR
jgi:uncharacterized protein (DUF58 family)